jgi:SAM-dependent methyltransferase
MDDSTVRHGDDPSARDLASRFFGQEGVWAADRFEGNEGQRLRARVTASLVDPQVRDVLDAGCGNGFITGHLRARECVIGLDRSAEAIKHVAGPAVLGSIAQLPFADRQFEAVLCSEVLEHLPSPLFEQAVAELSRVTERVLIVGVPYREDLRRDVTQCLDCGRPFHIHGHCRSFRDPQVVARLFPDFVVNARVLLGGHEIVASSLFRWAEAALLGPLASSPLGVCPACGSSRNADYRQLGRRRLAARVFEGLAWRLPVEVRPVWMIVRLRRPA